jgi:lactate dehydrogenase-like 2-hydroxyacid dehydrogenase
MKFNKAVLVNIADSHFDKKYWDQLDELIESRVSLSRDDPELKDELKDCDVLLLGFQVPTDKEIFDAAPNLKLINILATAYGTVDLEEAAKRNIPVCNLGGYSTEAVAEFSIAAILYVIRQIEEGRKRAQNGNYDFAGISARELKGADFGVVGLGQIGGRVAEIAAGFGANISYWSRNNKAGQFAYKELNNLLKSSSIISVNVAETSETKELLNENNLGYLQPGTVLISTVPQSIFNTKALADRLSKGDVTFISDHPSTMTNEELVFLKDLPNVVLIPGISFVTNEARIAKQEIFIGNIKAVLTGEPTNKVN